MKLDLKKNITALRKHFRERIREYPVYVNSGPGRDEDPVAQITLGYQCDQAGWAAIVFDTRPDAQVDGQWQTWIEENEVEFDQWRNASEALEDGDASVAVTGADGKKCRLRSYEELIRILGDSLRDLLVEMRDKGHLEQLPTKAGCRLTIEEHEGQYGWSARLDGSDGDDEEEETDELEITEEVARKAAKLSKRKQIDFWLGRLDELARRDETELLVIGDHMDKLRELGTDSVVPMLKLALKWSDKCEFDGDYGPKGKPVPGKPMTELAHGAVVFAILELAEDMEHSSDEVEKLLLQVVAKSVKANQGRNLWGVNPHFAARALFNLFDDYPCPELHPTNNSIDATPFLTAAK